MSTAVPYGPARYILDAIGIIVPFTGTPEEYEVWLNDETNTRIRRIAVPYGPGFKEAVLVSTVFTGYDQGDGEGAPVLLENNAVTSKGEHLIQSFHQTWKDADEGHKTMIIDVKVYLNFCLDTEGSLP